MQPCAKVLFITRKWAPATGGMETYSLRLAKQLANLTDCDVIALKGKASGMPPGVLALLGFPLRVLAARLRRAPPAVLHLGDLAIWPLGLLTGPQTQLVITAHGTDIVYGLRRHWRGRLYAAYLALGRKLLSRPTMIANSHATAAALTAAGWPGAAVIPLATDLVVDTVPPLRPDTVLFVGRLVERKGCAWFVRNVLPLLPEPLKLVVIGPCWEDDERAALAHPRVEYRGQVPFPDLVRAYGEALCVVMPNIPVASGDYEGFGIVAPEAAAAGGVVLAARHGGIADAVVDGETGFLIGPADAGAWAEAITAITRWEAERRKNFTVQAQAKVAAHYAWDRVGRDTFAAYGLPARSTAVINAAACSAAI